MRPGPPPRTPARSPGPSPNFGNAGPWAPGTPGASPRRGGGGGARGRGGRRGGGSGRRAGFLMQSGGGAGRARGAGPVAARLRSPLAFCASSPPGTRGAEQLRPGPARPAREGGAAASRPATVRPRRRPPGRATWAFAEEPKVCCGRSRRPPRGARGPSRFPVSLANFAASPTRPPARRRPGGGAQRSGRPSGHGRGPERGRGAGARGPSWAAAALRGADLPAGAPPTPACRVRAPACGWSCR